jgi:hypothetical protein
MRYGDALVELAGVQEMDRCRPVHRPIHAIQVPVAIAGELEVRDRDVLELDPCHRGIHGVQEVEKLVFVYFGAIFAGDLVKAPFATSLAMAFTAA